MDIPIALREFQSQYRAAKNELAAGHTDAGLRLLWALRHRLAKDLTEESDVQEFKKTLENMVRRWGKGFEWN